MLVKQKEKSESVPMSFRASKQLQNRIDNLFNRVKAKQTGLKRAELIRDAIERGLSEIEKQLEAKE